MTDKLSPDGKKLTLPISSLPMDENSYILKRNTYYRSEPGCDDVPPVIPPLKRTVVNGIKALESRYREVEARRKFIRKIKNLPIDEELKKPYLESLTHSRISISDETLKFDLEQEILTPNKCSTVYASLLGLRSKSFYHILLHCMRFWCEKCGGNGKKIHRRRKGYDYRKMNKGETPGSLAEIRATTRLWNLQQFVFTVPEKDRYRFMSWKGLNKLFGVARRTIKDLFSFSRVMAYMHTVGDKDLSKFNPHVNVHIFHLKRDRVRLKLSPDVLDAVKDRWARGLRELGCSDVRGPGESIIGKKVDVHYLYASKVEKVLHKIKYMTRPLGPEHLEAWRQDIDGQAMIDLHIQELKGFQFMRAWDRWAKNKYSDKEDVTKETKSKVGEAVMFMCLTHASVIEELLKVGQLEKVGEDLYFQRYGQHKNRPP